MGFLCQHCHCPSCVPFFVNARPEHELDCPNEHLDFYLIESGHYQDPDTWSAMTMRDALAIDGLHAIDSLDNAVLDYSHQDKTVIDNPGLES